MKLLYLDCGMGAAGDMLTAALCELLPEPDAFIAEMNQIGLHGVEIRREKSEKCGICLQKDFLLLYHNIFIKSIVIIVIPV